MCGYTLVCGFLAVIFALIVSACSRGFTSVEIAAKYLSKAKGGTSTDAPVPLALRIDLQNMLSGDSGWKRLLGAINTAGRYVALDLSGCTMPGTEFNPDPEFADGKKFIVSLVLPNTAKSVAAGTMENPTFQHFGNLTNVPTGKNFTTIGDWAFYNNQLTDITIPDSVTTIGERAFQGAIDFDQNTRERKKTSRLTSVTIGSSVTTIGDWAFSNNLLTSVIIGNSVTTIGNGAFFNNLLTSVIIGNSVTTIGSDAFHGNRLTSVTIGNSVTTIGKSAFYNNQLTGITIPNSVTSIGGGAFGKNQLTSVTVGNSVTTIGSGAFAENQLTSATIPDSVTTIGAFAFAENQLTNVTIGNSVTTIGSGAFDGNQLTSVTIPNSVTTIEEVAFCNNQLTSVTIGANVYIYEFTFSFFDDGFFFNIGFYEAYNNGGRQAGTYTRPNTDSTMWTRRGGGQSAASGQDQVFPSGFIGTWKRDNFDNTLTFTTNTLKSSSQTYFWTLVDLSGNKLTIRDDSRVNYTASLGIRLVNGNIEISGDSGNGDNNWNGTWKKW